jgi:hypothetical protein
VLGSELIRPLKSGRYRGLERAIENIGLEHGIEQYLEELKYRTCEELIIRSGTDTCNDVVAGSFVDVDGFRYCCARQRQTLSRQV